MIEKMTISLTWICDEINIKAKVLIFPAQKMFVFFFDIKKNTFSNQCRRIVLRKAKNKTGVLDKSCSLVINRHELDSHCKPHVKPSGSNVFNASAAEQL